MKISKPDELKLDNFINESLGYIKTKDKPKYYMPNTKFRPGSGSIELISGILVPESTESVLVLDKEYGSYLIDLVYKFAKLMLENIENPLFGFAERTLYELITLWFFIDKHPEVTKEQRDRVKVLLFAGHYKYVSSDRKELAIYLRQRQSALTAADIKCLGDRSISEKDYFNRLWSVAVTIKMGAGVTKYESILSKYGDFTAVSGHQSMRVHANPLSMNETLNNTRIKLRRKLLLCLYNAQICDYLAAAKESGASKMVKKHEDLRNSIKIEVG